MYQDIVDTTPFSLAEPRLRADVITKVVLKAKAINSTLDNKRAPPSLPQY